MESPSEQLERAYVQFLNQIDDLWDWHYRLRLAELRRNTKPNQWIDGIHVPSKIAGGLVMLCWLCDELWVLDPYPWDIKKDAEAEAYRVFVKEIRDG